MSRAGDLVREVQASISLKGFTKGRNEDPATGALSLYGSVNAVSKRLQTESGAGKDFEKDHPDAQAWAAARQAIFDACPDHFATWSDAPSRTRAEVLAMLTQAAAAADQVR